MHYKVVIDKVITVSKLTTLYNLDSFVAITLSVTKWLKGSTE